MNKVLKVSAIVSIVIIVISGVVSYFIHNPCVLPLCS